MSSIKIDKGAIAVLAAQLKTSKSSLSGAISSIKSQAYTNSILNIFIAAIYMPGINEDDPPIRDHREAARTYKRYAKSIYDEACGLESVLSEFDEVIGAVENIMEVIEDFELQPICLPGEDPSKYGFVTSFNGSGNYGYNAEMGIVVTSDLMDPEYMLATLGNSGDIDEATMVNEFQSWLTDYGKWMKEVTGATVTETSLPGSPWQGYLSMAGNLLFPPVLIPGVGVVNVFDTLTNLSGVTPTSFDSGTGGFDTLNGYMISEDLRGVLSFTGKMTEGALLAPLIIGEGMLGVPAELSVVNEANRLGDLLGVSVITSDFKMTPNISLINVGATIPTLTGNGKPSFDADTYWDLDIDEEFIRQYCHDTCYQFFEGVLNEMYEWPGEGRIADKLWGSDLARKGFDLGTEAAGDILEGVSRVSTEGTGDPTGRGSGWRQVTSTVINNTTGVTTFFNNKKGFDLGSIAVDNSTGGGNTNTNTGSVASVNTATQTIPETPTQTTGGPTGGPVQTADKPVAVAGGTKTGSAPSGAPTGGGTGGGTPASAGTPTSGGAPTGDPGGMVPTATKPATPTEATRKVPDVPKVEVAFDGAIDMPKPAATSVSDVVKVHEETTKIASAGVAAMTAGVGSILSNAAPKVTPAGPSIAAPEISLPGSMDVPTATTTTIGGVNPAMGGGSGMSGGAYGTGNVSSGSLGGNAGFMEGTTMGGSSGPGTMSSGGASGKVYNNNAFADSLEQSTREQSQSTVRNGSSTSNASSDASNSTESKTTDDKKLSKSKNVSTDTSSKSGSNKSNEEKKLKDSERKDEEVEEEKNKKELEKKKEAQEEKKEAQEEKKEEQEKEKEQDKKEEIKDEEQNKRGANVGKKLSGVSSGTLTKHDKTVSNVAVGITTGEVILIATLKALKLLNMLAFILLIIAVILLFTTYKITHHRIIKKRNQALISIEKVEKEENNEEVVEEVQVTEEQSAVVEETEPVEVTEQSTPEVTEEVSTEVVSEENTSTEEENKEQDLIIPPMKDNPNYEEFGTGLDFMDKPEE